MTTASPYVLSAGTRVQYSAEGLRVLGGASPRWGSTRVTSERRGTVMKRITPNVVDVLWDDRAITQMLHVSYLESADLPAATEPGA